MHALSKTIRHNGGVGESSGVLPTSVNGDAAVLHFEFMEGQRKVDRLVGSGGGLLTSPKGTLYCATAIQECFSVNGKYFVYSNDIGGGVRTNKRFMQTPP